MAGAKASGQQLLHLVFGGELTTLCRIEFSDLKKLMNTTEERLQGQHTEHRLRVVAHVGALGGRPAGRHPPQPEQAHDVVDAQPPRMPEGGADGLAKWLVRSGTELMRDEGWQSPVLPQSVVLVWRCAHRYIGGEHVLPGPGVGAVRIAKRATAEASGRRTSAGQACHFPPYCSASAQKVANCCRTSPCSWR